MCFKNSFLPWLFVFMNYQKSFFRNSYSLSLLFWLLEWLLVWVLMWMICLLYRFHRRVTSSLSSYFSRNSSSSTSPGKSLWSYYHLCFMHRSSTILCPIACWVGTWKLWLHIVVSCGRHPTTPLLCPGRQISYWYAWVDGILVESLSRVMQE